MPVQGRRSHNPKKIEQETKTVKSRKIITNIFKNIGFNKPKRCRLPKRQIQLKKNTYQPCRK